jgi:hypothetical protein
MDKIKSKWESLIQSRPNVRGIVGSTKLIGGHISHNDNHDRIFIFITPKGIFLYYNEATDEFESKLQTR